MSEHMLYDESGFLIFCTATESPRGRWDASVLFERKSDQSKALVPAMRHKLPDDFATSAEALSVAYHFGAERAAKGLTELK